MSLSRTSARVLIVEDDPLVAFALCAMLNAKGYEVVASCESVGKALEAAANTPFDILITDINLAGQRDGLQGALAIRRLRDVPVVFCTATMDASTLGRLRSVPRSKLLSKPFKTLDFLNALSVTLNAEAERETRLELTASSITRVGHGATAKLSLPQPCSTCTHVCRMAVDQFAEAAFTSHSKQPFEHLAV